MQLMKRNPAEGKRCMHRLLYLLILAALAASLAPSFLQALSTAQETRRISGYADSAADSDKELVSRIRKKAIRYNHMIFHRQQKMLFHYRGGGENDREYQSLLNPDQKGTMGYIEIPEEDIYLPVGHGTSADLLRKCAGHMYGTSLPVGCKSANAVITAHSGLASAKLFSDLDKVEKGDIFRFHLFGEVHLYKVASADVVLPEEETSFLQIEPGKDMITLYTCTPKGVNDHRLIVRGYRCGTEREESKAAAEMIQRKNLLALLKAAALAAVPGGYTAVWLFLRKRLRREI